MSLSAAVCWKDVSSETRRSPVSVRSCQRALGDSLSRLAFLPDLAWTLRRVARGQEGMNVTTLVLAVDAGSNLGETFYLQELGISHTTVDEQKKKKLSSAVVDATSR